MSLPPVATVSRRVGWASVPWPVRSMRGHRRQRVVSAWATCTVPERACARDLLTGVCRRWRIRGATGCGAAWLAALDWGSRGPGFKSRQPDHGVRRAQGRHRSDPGPALCSWLPGLAPAARPDSVPGRDATPGGVRGRVGCSGGAPEPVACPCTTGLPSPCPSCPWPLERGCARSSRTVPCLPTPLLPGRHGSAKPGRTFRDNPGGGHGLTAIFDRSHCGRRGRSGRLR